MADVGVLNLQIHDNSEQAVKGLEALDGVLLRIRHVVSGALGLGKVSSSLKKLTDTVNNELHGSTIVKLGQLADELSKLKGIGDLNIRIGGGTSIESIRNAVRETMQDMTGINTGFDDIKSRAFEAKGGIDGMNSSLRDTQELMQNKAWAGGIDQFREMFEEYSRIRSALSLPAGDQTGISTQVENGWTAWKEGAIEVEGTVSDAMDTVTARLGEPIQYLTGMSSELGNMNDYLGQTNGLMDEMARNTSSMSSGENAIIPYAGVKEEIKETIEETREAVNTTNEYADAVRNVGAAAGAGGFDAAIEFARQWNQSTGSGNKVADSAKEDIAYIDELVSKSSDIDLLNMKIEALTDKLYEGATSGKMTGDQIADMISRINSLKDEIEDLERTTTGMTGAWNSFKGGMQALFPTISNLLKRFKSMATMRALRYVIRSVAAGFSEGVQNVYHYSKAVGTSLAPAMDQAATAMQQMKNSIGAAVAPVIQSLVPVLQTVVNWFITAMNYANQFLALLRGQSTWTRALPEQAEAFEKSTKSAKGASKAMKDLLADWDELNIIQSQSGNGGGSGTGKTAEEYSQMFEEVSEFDSKVKDVLSFIDDYLGGLPGVLTKAGAILLGWKFSKAFSGLLGTLGKLVAGGALIAVGLDLSFGAGFEAGSKGYWDAKDIVEAVAGGLASAIGGSVITSALGMGGGVGFAIGLTGALVVTLVGYIQGQNDLKDKNKWGNLTMTQDQINQFVKDQFTFPVDAEIDVMKAHIADTTDAENKVNDAVKQFNSSLKNAEKIVADIDTTTAQEKVAAVKKAAEDAQATVSALQSLIETNEKGLEFTLTNFTFRNEAGEDITDELLGTIKGADATLSEYFMGLGEKLAKLIYEGEKSGWKNGEMEQAIELMRSQQRILENSERIEKQLKFETQFSSALEGVIDRDTAVATMETQKQMFAEYEETVRASVEQEADVLMGLAAKAYAAAMEAGEDSEIGKSLKKTGDEFVESAQRMMGENLQRAVDEKLEPTKDKMAKKWAEALEKVYGPDFKDAVDQAMKGGVFEIDAWDMLLDPFGNSYSLTAENIKKHGIKETADELVDAIIREMTTPGKDPKGIISNYLNDLGGDLYDVMSDESKETLLRGLYRATDDLSLAEEIFMKMFNVPYRDVEQYTRRFFNDAGEIIEETAQEAERGWWEFWKFTPPEDDLNVTTKPEITAEPTIDLQLDERQVMTDLKNKIEAALSDGQLDFTERTALELTFGKDAVTQLLNELEYNLDEEGYSTGRGLPKNGYYVASAGAVSDVGWGPSQSFVSAGGEPVEMQAEVEGGLDQQAVAAGVREGNKELAEAIANIMSSVRILAAKQWNVNIYPSATMGFMNGAAAVMASRVTGDIP